jgi:MerR family transcriptional regulator, thiopeptide resistance regulator
MSMSINEVARLSGVTSRTLRHYDAIGLLPPAYTATGGRRYYEQGDLFRLQRILLLRDLGLGLDAIAEVLAGQDEQDAVDVLARHRDWLVAERDRMETLIHTVESTMTNLREGGEMTPEKIFEGFEENPYEDEARQRWGDKAIDDSYARMRSLSPEDRDRAMHGWTESIAALREVRDAGLAVDDERVQQVIQGHREWLELSWTPNRESYTGLAEMYYDDERFRQNIGQGDDELVAYLRDAMKVYAEDNLA